MTATPGQRRPRPTGRTCPHRAAVGTRHKGLRPARRHRGRLRVVLQLLGWEGWSKLASLMTAVAAVAALGFTALSLRATQDQIGLSEQGQLTDRFGKAVEQLGSDKLDVRLGGIYALERLAKDSSRDDPTIMELLAAFTREHAPSSACKPDSPPPTDIQATLTVIGRRDHARDAHPLDLHDTCLAGTNLGLACLAGAILIRANLTHASLDYTILTGVALDSADLTGAHLTFANLTGATLTHAHLHHAWLRRANLTGANLAYADLTYGVFADTTLTRANLGGTNLTSAFLDGANLEGATGVTAPTPSPPTR